MLKNLSKLFILTFFIVGCETTQPISSMSYEELELDASSMSTKLDINVVELDPGIYQEDAASREAGIWPELRRAESRRFAVKMMRSLNETNAFANVTVTTSSNFLSDIVISGQIQESNGEDVRLLINAVDSTGKSIIKNKVYSHRTNEYFYQNLRNKDKDPFDKLFDDISNDLIKSLRSKDLYNIQQITELRFAREMDMANFQDSVIEKHNIVYANFIPAANDPLFLRTKNIRSKDLLFRSNMQSTYDQFIGEMSESYDIWQKASFTAAQKARKAKTASTLKGIAGAALMIAGAVAMADSGSGYNYNPGAYTSGFVGALAGAALFDQAIADNQEAKIHKETINEVSKSFDGNIAPKVIELEGKTVTLDGNLSQQFIKWQSLLKEIYVEENSTIQDINIL